METSEEFEKVISFIETVLKERDDIEVLHDVLLKDKDGNRCQIDVLIEQDMGIRLGKVQIPVECKNWNSKRVERTDIGAFLDLLDSLNISKGIYVSKIGFQSGAIIKAQKSGKVLLYTLDQSETKNILDWIMDGPIYRYSLIPIFETLSIDLTVERKVGETSNSSFDRLRFDNAFVIVDGMKSSFIDFFVSCHNSMSPEDFKRILRKYKKGKERKNVGESVVALEYGLGYKEPLVLAFDDQSILVRKLMFKYDAQFTTEKSTEHYYREYTNYISEEVHAQVFTARFPGSKVDFIKGAESSVIGFVSSEWSKEINKIVDLGRIDEEE